MRGALAQATQTGPLSPNPASQNTAPQNAGHAGYVVTAVVVAHDAARMLPGLVQAVREQTHPVQRVVGVDTGSRDRSGAVLTELLGQDAVFGMEPETGYGAAIARALHRMGLLAYRLDESRQQPRGVVGDDDGSDDMLRMPRVLGRRVL